MKDFRHANLTITLNKIGNIVTMAWLGQSDAKDPASELTPYLQNVIEEVKGNQLTVKYNQLEFMNSSSVKTIIQFVTSLNMAGITTTVTYNTKSTWQRLSFEALKTFARKMEHITVQGEVK
jgi:anti-anti-sigma regulatory factor